MAQQYVSDAGVLIIPGAYPQFKVQAGVSGLSTTGVLMLVGEADGGPDYTKESVLADNSFGPDQLADVQAKYRSGRLVDAFRAAAAPANDPDIQGAPNRFILVKTNPSGKALAALSAIGGGTYATLYDKGYGQLGNLIYFTVSAKTSEVKPTTGAFTYIPAVGTVAIGARTNGGSEVSVTLAANRAPNLAQADIDALSGVACTGGALRSVIPGVAGNLSVAVSGNQITITYTGTWNTTPSVGDTLTIAIASPIDGGASDQNVGAYVVTAATTSTIVATKLSDAGKGGASIGVITAPVVVGSTAVTATTDFNVYAPLTITLESNTVVNGIGKSLELNELVSGTDLLTRAAFGLGTTVAATWISKTGNPKLLTSATEYSVQLNVNRQADNVQEQLAAGGQIALKLGYTGTSCSVVISPTQMIFTPAGGAGTAFTVNLADFPTIADLATFISAKAGYSAAVGTTALGQLSPLALDEGTFTLGTTFGNQTGRVKVDAIKFYEIITANSVLVQLGNPIAPAAAGLPDVMATTTYLAGGTRGATTDAVYNAALDELENVKGNFLVPLFSRDASADVTDGFTDAASTYTIANINDYARTHVNKMSTLKRRKNRQAFLSYRGTFQASKDVAQNLAAFRASLAFQDYKNVGSNGIQQFQGWMGASLAAGMQAAGFYRAIFKKGINCSGVVHADGSFKDVNETQVEDALLSGLLVARKSDDGGFEFVSDQTTYTKDSNFVFNSIQAVYVADVIALTTAQRMEKAFVGQSVADVSAALALSALEGIMADFLRLKLISASDDAPKGFKNAVIKISGTAMVVSVEVKLAGAIYFIPINFLVSQVTQTAAA